MSKITIYTTNRCPRCKQVKDFFRRNDIKFEEKDVSNNEEFLEEMVNKTGKALVPVIDFGEKFVIGFDNEIKKSLKKELDYFKSKPAIQ